MNIMNNVSYWIPAYAGMTAQRLYGTRITAYAGMTALYGTAVTGRRLYWITACAGMTA